MGFEPQIWNTTKDAITIWLLLDPQSPKRNYDFILFIYQLDGLLIVFWECGEFSFLRQLFVLGLEDFGIMLLINWCCTGWLMSLSITFSKQHILLVCLLTEAFLAAGKFNFMKHAITILQFSHFRNLKEAPCLLNYL